MAREMYGGESASPSWPFYCRSSSATQRNPRRNIGSPTTEHLLFPDAGSGDDDDDDEDMSGSGSDSDDSDAEDGPEVAYETQDALTTVTVEPLSLSRSPTPEPLPALDESDRPIRSSAAAQQQQQGSVHKKRVKNAPQARPKLTRKEKKDRATGPKKVKKKLDNKMKGTKGRANR